MQDRSVDRVLWSQLPRREATDALLDCAREALGDDWLTSLALASGMLPRQWEAIARHDADVPDHAAWAIIIVSEIVLSVAMLEEELGPEIAFSIRRHPDSRTAQIVDALIADLPHRFRPQPVQPR